MPIAIGVLSVSSKRRLDVEHAAPAGHPAWRTRREQWLTKNVFRSLTLATLATLVATIWVAEASARSPRLLVSSNTQQGRRDVLSSGAGGCRALASPWPLITSRLCKGHVHHRRWVRSSGHGSRRRARDDPSSAEPSTRSRQGIDLAASSRSSVLHVGELQYRRRHPSRDARHGEGLHGRVQRWGRCMGRRLQSGAGMRCLLEQRIRVWRATIAWSPRIWPNPTPGG